MKYVKLLGLAVMAAMALTALLGTGSASATVLCKTYETPCPAAWDYPAGTVIHATTKAGTSVQLRDTSGNTIATCTDSTIKGKTTNTGSATETVVGNIETLTLSACSQTSDVLAPGSFEIHYVGPKTKGTLTSKNASVTFGIFGVSCAYGTGEGTALGVMESDETMTAELNVEAILPKVAGGFLCPSDGILTANYVITSPKPLYFKEKTA